ncbi:hypothetical protein BXY75_2285 [Ulvibacter antarcticus]|uniref:Uncharacterized protein n=1 Tax=Ulvibacter antarcticus TaxID=442714 RepID=A0A3L9YDX7_9FLAO|nr:hypothetical protein BXY75_2285 [Ulvibacter antarcticus]
MGNKYLLTFNINNQLSNYFNLTFMLSRIEILYRVSIHVM